MPHEHHYSFVKSSSHKDNRPPQQEQSSSYIVADIPHVEGDFVHSLYQSGALKLVHQLYLSGDAADCGKRVLFLEFLLRIFLGFFKMPCALARSFLNGT